MSNPFARPRTTGEGLLGSVCWGLSCFGTWCGSNWLLAWLAHRIGRPGLVSGWFFPASFLVAELLVLRFAVLRAWMLTGWEATPTPRWLQVVAYAWFGLLVGLVLATLAFLLLLFTISWQ